MELEKQSANDAEAAQRTDLQRERSRWESAALMATCTMAMILNSSSGTAASIALPTIGRDLRIIDPKLQWIVSAFSLSSGCLLLFFGRVADLFGRKIVFLSGTAVLGVFSLGAGFARNEVAVDVLRGIQGIGGAAVIPASLGILAHSFPPGRTRSIAFATFAAGAPIGAAFGSLIGGALTQLTEASWRSSFFLIAGLSLAALLAGIFVIDKDPPSQELDRRIDWLGSLLVTAGLVLIVFALGDGNIAPGAWGTRYIIALLVLGVALLIMFILWQHYLERTQGDPESTYSWMTPPPLMKVSVWTRSHGRMSVMLCIAFLEWCSFMSWVFWVQLYYQNYLHLSPVRTMIRLIPMFVTGCICNVTVALLISHVDVVVLIVCGTMLTATAGLLFAVVDAHASYWAFGFPATVVSVFGADFVFAAGTLFVAKVCAAHEQSVAGALFQTMTQLGSSFGLAITTIIFNSTLTKGPSHLPPPSYNHSNDIGPPPPPPPPLRELSAYRAAMWGGFAFGVLGALLAAIFLRSVGVVGHVDSRKDKNQEET